MREMRAPDEILSKKDLEEKGLKFVQVGEIMEE